jgi:hypothetical protein
MPKLKITEFPNDKPVKLAIELPAAVHRDLLAYAEILAGELGQAANNPNKLVALMVARFMSTDRAFVKLRHATGQQSPAKSRGAPSSK